jgi:DNA (cytosine-5)-methyltransferase 1
VRYYTLREAAAIQTFPTTYRFPVSRSEAIRQIGNAVPCQLAQVVATALKSRLLEGSSR